MDVCWNLSNCRQDSSNNTLNLLGIWNLQDFLAKVISKLVHHQVSKVGCHSLNESMSESEESIFIKSLLKHSAPLLIVAEIIAFANEFLVFLWELVKVRFDFNLFKVFGVAFTRSHVWRAEASLRSLERHLYLKLINGFNIDFFLRVIIVLALISFENWVLSLNRLAIWQTVIFIRKKLKVTQSVIDNFLTKWGSTSI